MSQSIISLMPRHYKILELCLRGLTNVQIAEHLGMSPQHISTIINSPSFQHELAIRREKLDNITAQQISQEYDDVAQAIREGARQAVKRLLSCIDSPDEAIGLRASQDILDRAGFPKLQRVEQSSLSVNLSPEDAQRIRETLKLVSKDISN